MLLNVLAGGGPKLLPELAKNCALTYHELSEDEKAKILDAFEQHKLEESKSIQPSVKSRVADIRHTVNIIEKEVCSFIARLDAYSCAPFSYRT